MITRDDHIKLAYEYGVLLAQRDILTKLAYYDPVNEAGSPLANIRAVRVPVERVPEVEANKPQPRNRQVGTPPAAPVGLAAPAAPLVPIGPGMYTRSALPL